MATNRKFVVKHGLDANAIGIDNLGAQGSNLAFAGGHAVTLTTTGTTNLTLPTSGTLVTSASLPTVNNGTLTLAVSGSGLTGSASFTANQAGGSTFTVTSNATAANTASTIVFRDGSGNFSAGTITATGFSGSGASLTSLNASNLTSGTVSDARLTTNVALLNTSQVYTTANTFRAASSIRAEAAATQDAVILAGRAGGTGSFGVTLTPTTLTANRTLTLPNADGTVALATDIPTVNNGTLTLAVSGVGLSGSASFTANQAGSSTFTVTSNATSANTASTIVARDASGNFNAGTITATGFSGSGALLTSLNASNLSSGTVPDARISGTYTGLTNLTGSGDVDFSRFLGNAADSATAPSFSWTGDTNTGMFTPGADQLGFTTGGTARLTISNTAITAAGSAVFTGNGSGLTTLNASNLSSGSVPDARLSTNVVLLTGAQTITGQKQFNSPILMGTGSVYDVNGSGPEQQVNGLYLADLGTVQGTTLNPTFTAAIVGQFNTSRSVAFSVDGAGNLWGFRTHTGAGTYVWSSKVLRADQFTTARTIAISGGATGTATSFDGSANITIPVTALNADNINAGTVNDARLSSNIGRLNTSQVYTTANTFRAANAIRTEAAATQDAIVLAGRAGGTGSFAVTFTPTTLTANRTITLPNAAGTLALTSDIPAPLGYTPVNRAGDTMTGNLILNADPSTDLGAATKQYVDNVASGLSIHQAVRAATTGNLTATYNNGTGGVGATLTGTGALPAIDGVTVAVGNRVLVKNQSTAAQNGVYVATTITTNWVLTRAADFDNAPTSEVTAGDAVFVQEGGQGGTQWVLTTTGTITIGTTGLVFSQFAGPNTITAGTGISVSGNSVSLATGNTLSLFNLATNGMIARTAANTVTARTITGGANITVTNGDGVSGNPTISLSGTIADAQISGSYTGMVNLTGSGNVDFSRFYGTGGDTVTSPSFSWTGDTDTGIYTPAADQVGITAGGTQRGLFNSSGLTVTGTVTATTFSGSGASLTTLNASNLSSGTVATARLGTGTANSTTFLRGDGTWAAAGGGGTLNLDDGTAAAPSLRFTSNTNTGIFRPAANTLAITTAGTEIARFTTGTVGIGSTGAAGYQTRVGTINLAPVLQVSSTEIGDNAISMGVFRNDTTTPHLLLTKSRAGAGSYATAVLSGDVLGRLSWSGADGTLSSEGARIEAVMTANASANSMSTRLAFLVSNASNTPTSRMTVEPSGQITMPANIASTSTTTGTLVVTGGAGFSGDIYAAEFNGPLVGNASTATSAATLTTTRTFNLSGVTTGGAQNFNGSQNVVINVTGVPATLLTGTIADARISGSYTGITTLTAGNIVLTTPSSTVRLKESTAATGIAALIHHDASNFYLLLTNSGDANGTWNSLRPFTVAKSTGAVSMLNGLSITGGNLSISSGQILANASDTVAAPGFSWAGDTNVGIYRPAADTIGFSTNGSEAMRLTAANELLLGSTSAIATRLATNSLTPTLQNVAGSVTGSSSLNANYQAGVGGPILFMAKSRNATVGSHTALLANDEMGNLSFAASDGTQFTEGARIRAISATAPTANSVSGRLEFWTTSASATPAQRMSIGPTGQVAMLGNIASTSTTTGTLVVTGGVGVSGNIVAGGSIDCGTQFLGLATDSATVPSFSWTGDTNCGMFRPAADTIAFSNNGAEVLRITTDGSVGIRTTAPDRGLDVRSGNFAANQNFGLQIGAPGGQWKAQFNIKSDGGGTPRTTIDAVANGSGGTIEAISIAQSGVLTLSSALPIASGGTGATTAAAARAALGAGTGNGTVTSITVNTSGSGISGSGTITTTGTVTITSNATTANNASTIVLRDGSGNVALSTNSTANGVLIGYRTIPVDNKTASYTLTAADTGRAVDTNSGVTVPTGLAAGTTVTIYNNTTGNITITQGASVTLRLAGGASTGNRTLAQRGIATVWYRTTTEAIISGAGLT